MTAYIHVRTSFELVSEALSFLAKGAKQSTLALTSEIAVPSAERIGFCVSLEDDTCVIEGRGRVEAVLDRGPFAAADARYEVLLDTLELDERNARMFERVLEARAQGGASTSADVSWPPSMIPDDEAARTYVEPPRSSLTPPRVPELEPDEALPSDELELEPDVDEADVDDEALAGDERSSQTRVVRTEELLRTASASLDRTLSVSNELELPGELLSRARTLAPALVNSAGQRPSPAQVVVHALRIGLSVLEAQVAEDAWNLGDER